MLTHIRIRDFAIIDALELEFDSGLTVLTGETGAGKSILVDALGLALGDRADVESVRHGARRAEVEACFDITGQRGILAWLQARDLDADGECMVRRTVQRDAGRSRAHINDRPVALSTLRSLGDMLVDIHGQHEHQSLLRRDTHRALLDAFADHGETLRQLAGAAEQLRALEAERDELEHAARERETRRDALSYQIQELEQLNLGEAEPAALDEEHHRLANAGAILEACQAALQSLYDADEGSAHSLLHRTTQALEAHSDLDPRLAAARELVETAAINVGEAVTELRHFAGDLELDPQRLQVVEERLAAIHDAARKHRVEPHELPGLLHQLRDDLAGIEASGERAEAVAAQARETAAHYDQLAEAVGAARRMAAATLEQRVTETLRPLGMGNARLSVNVATGDAERRSAHGRETVEFLVQTNPDQPARPLPKIASGGELSRIALAIQVVAARHGAVPTLIFDEVDAGIGGGVAEIVGQRLRELGNDRQVLCVTHLPQVAAQAHHHLHVSKTTEADATQTRITPLINDERVAEVARMLGGVEITDQTQAHAREMIQRAAGSA